MVGWLLLVALTSLAAFAALAVAARLEGEPAGLEGRAEVALASLLIFYAVIVLPIFALGYTDHLQAGLLAIASIGTSVATFLIAARRRGVKAHAEATLELGRRLARVPGDAFRIAIAERSFAALGLAAALMAIVVSGWLSWLAVSESWDGFFYHEPIVGFALQNQGFRMVSLPPAMVVQGINGYPKLCEAFALWFVIFTDKTLIEIGNTVAAPGLVLATFILVRRFAKDTTSAMGWSVLVLLMPAMLTQLRTSMIDVEVQFFLVAALALATRPKLGAPSAAIAWLAMALCTGSKSSALAWVPPLALVAFARLVFQRGRPRLGDETDPRSRSVEAVLVSIGGALIVAGTAALTLVRNFIAFKNPVWPVTIKSAAFGIDWPGIATLQQVTPEPPLWRMIKTKYEHPIGGIPDIIARDYGYAVPWVIVPLAFVAVLVALFVAVRRRVAKQPDEAAESVLVVLFLGAVLIRISPSLNIGRYNAVLIAVFVSAIGFLASRLEPERDGSASRSAAGRFREGALAAATMLTLVPWIWTDWFFGVDLTFKDIQTLMTTPASERKSLDFAKFQMPSAVARAKERELGNGAIVVFTQDSNFIGAFFDHRMQNRLVYLEDKGDPSFVARLGEIGPRWVIVGERSRARALLAAEPARFELVGPAVKQDNTLAFRVLR